MEIYSLLAIPYSKPAIEIGNYMFKVNNRITRARYEINWNDVNDCCLMFSFHVKRHLSDIFKVGHTLL